MAFSDPQSITIDGEAHSMARTGSGLTSGHFTSTLNSGIKMTVSHVANKSRVRHTIRLDTSMLVPNPLIPDVNQITGDSIYLVVNTPVNSTYIDQTKLVVDGLLAYLTASSGAAVTKLLGGES